MRRSALLFVLSFAVVVSAHASVITVEGPQDSLAQPPQDFTMNHCTLRKAIVSANNDSSAAYPQCVSGSGLARNTTYTVSEPYGDVVVTSDAGQERWMRAMLRYQTGRRAAAAADADWLLEHRPPRVDMQRVEEFRRILDRP